ncbi:hypothetical protein H7X68_02080 [Candidatus Saccharibacteria bacterium]|nr:hypothetical protein [Candidatus Saccharibacteria bacterium]
MSGIESNSGSTAHLSIKTLELAYALDASFDNKLAAISAQEQAVKAERMYEAALQSDLAGLAAKKELTETDFLDCYRAIIEHYSQPGRAEHLEAMLGLRQQLVEGEVFLSSRSGEVAVERIASAGDGQPLAVPALVRRLINSGTYLGRNDSSDYDLVWTVSVESDDQPRVVGLSNRLGRPAVAFYLDNLAGKMPAATRADGFKLVGQLSKAAGYSALAKAQSAFVQTRNHFPGQSQQ